MGDCRIKESGTKRKMVNITKNIWDFCRNETVFIVAVLLDRLLNTGTWVFRTIVCYFYIANEGISLLENCAGLGLPVPESIQNALVQLKDGEKKELKGE